MNETKEQTPLISVIMPVHNNIEYLTDSINSVCNQTYSNLELIIVSTGSDDLDEITLSIGDNRIKYIRLDDDKGLTHAFYQGIKASSGDFITRHDPDDLSSPNRFKQQVDRLVNRDDLGMVSCLIKSITDNEKYRKACLFIEKVQNAYIEYEDIKNAVIEGYIPLLMPTLLIKRDVIETITIPEEGDQFDDQMNFLIDLLKQSSVEKINKVLYTYRRHNQAYHIVNEKEYEVYVEKEIENSDIKGYLKYKEFYEQEIECREPDINMQSIRILMLVDTLNIGGTETHVLSIVKKLKEMGIYVTVGSSGGPLTNLFEQNGIKVYKLPIEGDYISNKSKYALIKKVKDIVDQEEINLLHCHLFASMSIGNEMSKKFNIPYITTIHGMFYPKDVQFSTYHRSDAMIAVSEPVKKQIIRRLGDEVEDKVIVIPNGIEEPKEIENQDCIKQEIRKELNIPNDHLVLTYCSRLVWNKAYAAEQFLYAFFKLAYKRDDLHAIVVGDGGRKRIIEREAELLNECLGRKAIHIVGAKYNVNDYYLSSDIVIGTARVALEAMSCNKPVIATGNTGYVGIIDYKKRYIQWMNYFGDHDAYKESNVNNMYDDLYYLVTNDEEREKIANWSSKWCKKVFSIDRVGDAILKLYIEVINKKKQENQESEKDIDLL